MKIVHILLPFGMLFLAGCNSTVEDPAAVLSEFFSAMSQKNIEGAKKLVTEDSEGMINMMQMSLKNLDAPDTGDQFNPAKLTVGKATVNGDEAEVPVTEKASGETVNFFLKKEKGQWRVAFDMATIARMARQKIVNQRAESAQDSADADKLNKESKEFQKHLQGITDSLKTELDKKIK